MSTQESGPAFTSPPFDVSTDRICVNHITLTPPHLAPPVPKARPANTQSVNKYQYRRMSCRWQILPNYTVVPAGIHMPPLSPAHFPCNGGKITSTNTHCANHPVVMTCGCTLRMPPPIHRSSPQSPPLCIGLVFHIRAGLPISSARCIQLRKKTQLHKTPRHDAFTRDHCRELGWVGRVTAPTTVPAEKV